MAQWRQTAPLTDVEGDVSTQAPGTAGVHPFRALWLTRDLDRWTQALAPDVLLHSPVFSALFEGRDAAIELYSVLLDKLVGFEITHEFREGDFDVFFWHADIGRAGGIEGVDLIRSDEHGKVCDVKVMIRPLANIAIFADAVGPPLAAKRGRLRGLLVGLLSMPLVPLFIIVERVASRLAVPR